MKKKSIFILLAVLVVLVAAVFILEGPLIKRSKVKAAQESILFPGFETDQVSSVDIKTRDKNVKLKKEDNAWVVATAGNYPADPESIEDMLGKVKDLKSTLTASKSADKHSQFEVDGSGVEVTMLGTGEKPLAHFFVGKMGPDYISTYVRKADQDEVLLVGEYLRGVFDKGARGWRDRTIFDFDASQVQTLTLVSEEKGEIAIAAQEDGGWQIIKPEVFPAEKEAVDDIVREISRLEADDFAEKKEEVADPLKEYKLDKPQSKIMADLNDGTARALFVGDESGYRRYVKREDKDTIFLVSKSKIDRIFKGLEELKAESSDEASKPEEAP